MRVSIILPRIDLVEDPQSNVNGANIALWTQLRTYANHPAVDCLELFLAPRDLIDPTNLKPFADRLLCPKNRGIGRVSFHGIHSLPNVWSDGVPRLLHTDDLWAMARDRYLRDRLARGPIAQVVDTHCLGHWSIWQALRDVSEWPAVPFDAIAAISGATANALYSSFSRLGCGPPVTIELSPRRIDETSLWPAMADEKQGLRQKLGVPPDGPLALYLGRLTPAMKGDLLLLVDVLADSANRDARLAVVGVENLGGYTEVVRNYAKERGVADRVHFHGRIDPSERGDWYRAADLFVFPADCLNEAFGQTTLEAMACGLPIVASAWDGLKDTLHADYAFLAPVFVAKPPERFGGVSSAVDVPTAFFAFAQATVIDRRVFQSGFDALVCSQETRLAMGKAARRHYEERFSASLLEDQWIASRLAQVARASEESDESRYRRREAATQYRYEIPYDEQLKGYATHFLCDATVEMTPAGREWCQGRRSLPLYGEIRVMTDERLFAAIAERVHRGPCRLCETTAALTQTNEITEEDVAFHVMLLAKHGYVSLDPATAS